MRSIFVRATETRAPHHYRKNVALFHQGEAAGSVFYIQSGSVRLSVLAPSGKEAIIGVLEPGQLAGESCLLGGSLRTFTATAIEETDAYKVPKATMERLLSLEPDSSTRMLKYVLARNMHVESNLVDQLFNSSDRRLARLLLRLSHIERSPDGVEGVVRSISQGALGEMIGTTRETVNVLMKKFKEQGHLEWRDDKVIVRNSLYSVLAAPQVPDAPSCHQSHAT